MIEEGRIRDPGRRGGIQCAPAVFLIAFLLSMSPARAGLPTNGMVLFYSFDTDQGTTVTDESGGGNDGLATTNAWSSFGISHGAFRFYGSNDYVHAGPMFNWTNFSGGFSLSFWTRQIQPESRAAYFAGTTGGSGALTNRFELGCNIISQGELLFQLYDDGGNLLLRRYAATGVDDGEWHHVAMLVGTNGTDVRLLLDSVELATSESSGTVVQLTAGLNFPLVIGTTGDGGGGISSTNSLNGYLDDFRIFGRLLATGEVATLYRMMEEEPDDTRGEARLISPGQTKNHTMKALDDENWAFFYAFTNFTNYVFSTKNNGTNVDTRITAYRALEDGTLGLVTSVNNTAMGLGLGETWSFANFSNDLYFVKITTPTGLYGPTGKRGKRTRLSGGDAGFGEGSEYESELAAAPVSINSIYVVAAVYPNRAAGQSARVDGTTHNFSGASALLFSGLNSGTHTARVQFLSGVRPLEHPTRPGQVQNQSSSEYGNPRFVYLSGSPAFEIAVFRCEQVNYQKATVRDSHTGEHVENVSVRCISDSAPFVDTETRRGHAYETAYQQLWRTRSDGSFPSNLMLYPTTWDILLSATDYSNRTLPDAVSAVPWGQTNDLGEILLCPLDLDGNGIGDAWERRYFPPEELPVAPWDDEDEDGLNNWSEYMAGTNPTSAVERLQMSLAWEKELPRLRWTGRRWRRYRVGIQAVADEEGWDSETDTVTHWGTSSWEEAWSDVNWAGHSQRVYRLEVIRPSE